MRNTRKSRWMVAAVTLLAISLMAALFISCGGDSSQQAPSGEDADKYPPGTSEEMLTETTGSGNQAVEASEEAEEEEAPTTAPPGTSAELAGARFTVISATRPDSNADVITTGQREVPGDYLEIELQIDNIGDDVVDLSQYSFRLWSPGIDADAYEDYYRGNGTYGKYVSKNMVSAVLLDYTTLQPAAYVLKMAESVDGVFLFYDLNPKSATFNEGVTKEGTNLVIRKLRGDDSGEEVEINLAGYAD